MRGCIVGGERCSKDEASHQSRKQTMDAVNPLYIPRNHRVQEAIDAAVENDDFSVFESYLAVCTRPFEFQDSVQSLKNRPKRRSGFWKRFVARRLTKIIVIYLIT